MGTEIGCAAVLLGVMCIVASVAANENAAGVAEKRGLSPIIEITEGVAEKRGLSPIIHVTPQNVPVMIAQANQSQPDDVKTTRTMGVCYPVPNDNYSAENGLVPTMDAQAYLREYEHRKVQDSAIITILQQPNHGTLRLVTEADRGTFFDPDRRHADESLDPANPGYVYLPEKGYLGKDSATVLVEIGGIKVKIAYFFQAIEGPLGNTGWEDLCTETGLRWKISSTS